MSGYFARFCNYETRTDVLAHSLYLNCFRRMQSLKVSSFVGRNAFYYSKTNILFYTANKAISFLPTRGKLFIGRFDCSTVWRKPITNLGSLNSNEIPSDHVKIVNHSSDVLWIWDNLRHKWIWDAIKLSLELALILAITVGLWNFVKRHAADSCFSNFNF